ncbi:hypothetical protein [Xenorhabdus sp. Sc-CR9]|uniref:hypothetical protein n=1 Tax=Xenorhabdus sp. Sc-CR9 TaxID=2584468 RepID=UPI001F4604FC|nr:hypothetical protein [Xenorhabdus sp. Sc-CR9]
MPPQKLPWGAGRRLAVGNEAAMKHGRYAVPRSIDLDNADALIAANEDFILFQTSNRDSA